ncbi:MAG: phage tail tape measure protein, partial [Peptostreptococcales bacterium]
MASKTINTILNLKDNFSKTVKKTTDNTKKFQRQIKQAENQAKKMRESVSKGFKIISAGAVAAGVGMFALVNKTAEAMDEVDKMSERTGLTRERLQELKYAAAQCDVEFTTLENGVKMLTKNMGKADEESKRMVDAFEKMGIEIKDGNGNIKSSTELFEESIKKLADMEDQTERNIVGQKIFGNSYQDMIPLLNQGSKGIKELTDRSRELGLVIDEEAVKANVVFGDTLTDVKLSVGALGMRLSNVLLPYFQRFADYALTVIPKIEPTIKKVFGKMAEAINRIRENMNWLLPVAAGLLGTFMAFQIITTITAAIRAYTTFTKGLTLAQALLNKTMLGNPMVWMAIGIGVLIAAGVALWKNWDTVKEKLSGAW